MHLAGIRGPMCPVARDWAFSHNLWDPAASSWQQFFLANVPDVEPSVRFIAAIDVLYRWSRSAGFTADTRAFSWALGFVSRRP